MEALVFLFFIVIFGAVVVAMLAVQHYHSSAQKKRVTERLQGDEEVGHRVETRLLRDVSADGEPALLQFLSRFNVIRKMESEVEQSGLKMKLAGLFMQMALLGAVCGFVGYYFRPLITVVWSAVGFGVFGAMLPYMRVRRARTKRMNAFEEQFPEALDFLARAMRAGHAFSISMEMLAEESGPPLGQEFKKVFNEHNLGLPIETALQNLTKRVPLIDVGFFVSAVLLQRETGGNLAEILTKLAAVIRDRFKVKGQVKAASAHGRITGAILTLMPVALMMGLMLIAPGYLPGMAKDPDGIKLIYGAIAGVVLGHLCIRKIVNIKV